MKVLDSDTNGLLEQSVHFDNIVLTVQIIEPALLGKADKTIGILSWSNFKSAVSLFVIYVVNSFQKYKPITLINSFRIPSCHNIDIK